MTGEGGGATLESAFSRTNFPGRTFSKGNSHSIQVGFLHNMTILEDFITEYRISKWRACCMKIGFVEPFLSY